MGKSGSASGEDRRVSVQKDALGDGGSGTPVSKTGRAELQQKHELVGQPRSSGATLLSLPGLNGKLGPCG